MARPFRVLYVEANADGTVGGSHQVLYDLARGLNHDRYQPVALFYQHNIFAERLTAAGVPVLVVEELRAREAAAHRSGRLERKLAVRFTAIRDRLTILRDHGIDLLHLNNAPSVGLDDWLPAAMVERVPCVVNAAGYAPERRAVKRLLYAGFDRVLPVSEYIAGKMHQEGFSRERRTMIHPGIDILALQAQATRPPATVRRALGIAGDEVFALMVGNIREWKGQHVVVEAVRRLAPELQGRLQLRFAGAPATDDLPYLRALETVIAEAGLSQRVTFLGRREDVPDLLRAADIAVHASVTPEPFGLVVPEAMALGAAVIAANTGGPAEVVAPGTGLLFDPTKPAELTAHLAALIADPARRQALVQSGRKRAEWFTTARYVAGVEQVYDEVLRGARPRARGAQPAGVAPPVH